jgi:hypothetical protein
MILHRPSYNLAPFRDCDALGWHLGIPGTTLQEIAASADQFYYLADRIPKSDGTVREVYGARDPLRTVQKKILDRMLRHVHYPAYLMGGIRDLEQPRDYIRNAGLHAGRGTLIQEDVSAFYPSTTRMRVANVFRGLLHLPPDVADCLALLCTRNGELAQGASPSTYLANLVLWEREPQLEAQLRGRGIRYTRYIDDINVSSRRLLPTAERTAIVQSIYLMLRSYGYTPKRTKQSISSTGTPMKLHGLSVHSGSPILPRPERRRIRAAVFEFEQQATVSPCDPRTWTSGLSVRSRLVIWRRLNHSQAAPLLDRVNALMNEIKPLHAARLIHSRSASA